MHKNFSALTMLGEWWYIHKERKHGGMERQNQCSYDTHTTTKATFARRKGW